jgi:hypothetical protein
MEENSDFTSIKNEIESYLRYGNVFDYVLKKNPKVYQESLELIPVGKHWFEYKQSDINFISHTLLDITTNDRGDFFYRYVSDFNFTGNICYSENDHREHKLPVKIDATVRVYKNPDFSIRVTDDNNDIEVWDLNQKIINLNYYLSSKILPRPKSTDFDFGNYAKIRSKIDRNNDVQGNQSQVTSFYYLDEVVESYERIRFLLSMVLMNADYANNYTERKTELPSNYLFRHMFTTDNFSLYDRMYLLYAELALESLYKYWERIGYFIFQFIKPQSGKVNQDNISLFKLVKELNNEYPANQILNNDHFRWFTEFVINTDSEFQKLTNYRHPFVHYRYESTVKEGKGGLVPTTLSKWSHKQFDEIQMKSLEQENKNLQAFLLSQFAICKDGYEQMVELIMCLPDLH